MCHWHNVKTIGKKAVSVETKEEVVMVVAMDHAMEEVVMVYVTEANQDSIVRATVAIVAEVVAAVVLAAAADAAVKVTGHVEVAVTQTLLGVTNAIDAKNQNKKAPVVPLVVDQVVLVAATADSEVNEAIIVQQVEISNAEMIVDVRNAMIQMIFDSN